MRAATAAATVIGVAALAAACHPARVGEHRNERPFSVSARLDCPEREGRLSRIEAAADGQTCRYQSDGGDERVTLERLAVTGGSPQAALATVEASLKQAVPRGGGGATASSVSGDNDRADIDLPGFHIHSRGDAADINLPGVSINADGDNAKIQVNKPGGRLATINADHGGAEIRTGDITARNVDAFYLLASDQAGPTGDKAAGYIAKGPVGGPLIVGIVNAREGDHTGDHQFGDVKRLVNRNATRGARS